MVLFCSVLSQLKFVTGTAVAIGMTTACDTYFSQYHGSVNRYKLGVILQKGESFAVCVDGKLTFANYCASDRIETIIQKHGEAKRALPNRLLPPVSGPFWELFLRSSMSLHRPRALRLTHGYNVLRDAILKSGV